jgi:hypothetical protein
VVYVVAKFGLLVTNRINAFMLCVVVVFLQLSQLVFWRFSKIWKNSCVLCGSPADFHACDMLFLGNIGTISVPIVPTMPTSLYIYTLK